MEQSYTGAKGKLKNSFLILVFFILILGTDTVSIPLSNSVLSGISSVICLILFVWIKPYKYNEYDLNVLFLLILFTLLSQIKNLELSFAYEMLIFYWLGAYAFVTYFNHSLFSKLYVNFMIFISCISLLSYISGLLNLSWINFFPLNETESHNVMILTSVPVTLYGRLRNYGPFWEPGVYQAYLNYALILCLFKEIKINWTKVLVLVLTIITTLSTTGFIVTLLIFFSYFYSKRKINSRYILALIVFGILIYFVTDSVLFQEMVWNKVSTWEESRSTQTRFEDVKIYSSIFIEHPLFGDGLIHAHELSKIAYSKDPMYITAEGTSFEGATTTLMRQFASLGFVVGLVQLFLVWRYSIFLSTNKFIRIVFLVVFEILLNTECLIYSLMFNTIFFYGVSKQERYKKISIQM